MRRAICLFALLGLVFAACLSTFAQEKKEEVVFVQLKRYAAFGSEQKDAAALGISAAQYDALRERLSEAMRGCAESCSIADFGIQNNQAAYECLSRIIFKDDPAMFHLGTVNFSYTQSTNTYTRISFSSYKYDKETYAAMLADCEEAARQLTADLVNSGLSQAELALILHDRLAVRCEYDYDNYRQGTVPEESYCMYGPLINRISVCEGYTQAYIYLLAKVGINSRMCSSETLNHAWNIVEIDGELYHVDITWDDPVYDQAGRVEHDNFLRSTAGIISTGHEATDFDTAPDDTRYDDAFWRTEGIDTQFCYLNGKIYHIDPATGSLVARQGEETVTLSVDLSDTWYAGQGGSYWQGNFNALACDGTYLYFNKSEGIWRYDPAAGQARECFRPDLSDLPPYFYIYAFTVDGGEFVYEVYNTPALNQETLHNYRFRAPIPEPPQTTVTAVSVQTMPLRRVYAVGSAFDGTGLSLLVTNSDGGQDTVDSGYTAAFDSSLTGERSVTLTYEGATVTFTVIVTDVLGDVDGDGEVTSTDARMALMAAMDKLEDVSLDPALAEADGDMVLTSTDARLILQYAVEMIDEWPAAA